MNIWRVCVHVCVHVCACTYVGVCSVQYVHTPLLLSAARKSP